MPYKAFSLPCLLQLYFTEYTYNCYTRPNPVEFLTWESMQIILHQYRSAFAVTHYTHRSLSAPLDSIRCYSKNALYYFHLALAFKSYTVITNSGILTLSRLLKYHLHCSSLQPSPDHSHSSLHSMFHGHRECCSPLDMWYRQMHTLATILHRMTIFHSKTISY